MTVRAKYPIKIGAVLVPAQTVGEVLPQPTPRILESFPNLKFTENGQMYLVKFPEVPECLVRKDQVI